MECSPADLVVENLPLAQYAARRFARSLPPQVSLDDVTGAAVVGLTEAAFRYKPECSDNFAAYAQGRIRGAIVDYLRSLDLASRKVRRRARELDGTNRDLRHELGREPTELESAEALGLTIAEYRRQREQVRCAPRACALDELSSPPSDRESPIDVALHRERRALLAKGLRRLSSREQDVVLRYYDRGMTLREIGADLGVTESRVCQLHRQALDKLQRFFKLSFAVAEVRTSFA